MDWRLKKGMLLLMKIILDAMGGDNAPDAVIKGAVKAINEIESEIILLGDSEIINAKVKEFIKLRIFLIDDLIVYLRLFSFFN